jgi:predicted nucleic acid-binding protein
MSPIAVYDANVLFSATLRDFFVWLGVVGACQPRWTTEIHEEWIRSVLAQRASTEREKLDRCQQLMDKALKDALVVDYETLIPQLLLPDRNDRHVLAAAIRSKASLIVTFNLADFPASILSQHHVHAIHPDDFAEQLFQSSPVLVIEACTVHRASLFKPAKSTEEYFATLEKAGLPSFVSVLREQEVSI